MSVHIVSKNLYYRIFATLMVLTMITIGVAFINLGRLNTIIALSIAVSKATLVILYFMHVRYSPRLIWVVVVAGLFWLGIMIALTLGDYLTRGWLI